MSLNRKRVNLRKFLYYFVLLSFLLPIAYLVVRICTYDETGEVKTLADYVLMLVQCALGALVIHIPSFLARRLRVVLPTFLYVMYIIFLYCAIFLGEVRSFYYLIPQWDDILHCCSSMMTGMFAFMVVTILNDDKDVALRLSPAFVALFAFSFSLMLGALWEIYEYTFDGVLGLNMQKFILADGTVLTGHAALSDTMEDFIVDALGALTASLIGYFSLKRKKGWAHELMENSAEESGPAAG